MKIELRNIKHSSELSKETYAFSAQVFINDCLIGEATNQGAGGATRISVIDHDRSIIEKANQFLVRQGLMKVHGMELKPDLSLWVDLQVDSFVNAKKRARLKEKIYRKSVISLIVCKRTSLQELISLRTNDFIYEEYCLPKSFSKDRVDDVINRVYSKLKSGYCILYMRQIVREKAASAEREFSFD